MTTQEQLDGARQDVHFLELQVSQTIYTLNLLRRNLEAARGRFEALDIARAQEQAVERGRN